MKKEIAYYFLCKKKFFSVTLMKIIKYLVRYIEENDSCIKQLFNRKKQGFHNIHVDEILDIYIFDEIIQKLLGIISNSLYNFYSNYH